MLDLDFGPLRDRDGDDTIPRTRAELRRQRASDGPIEILTVCTGNICRSPLAEQVLRARIPGPEITSAGTHALPDDRMPDDAVRLASLLGVPAEEAEAHRARRLTERVLESPALILTMTRQHRHTVVDLAPGQLRRAFTIREFARLSTPLDDARLAAVAAAADGSPGERFQAVVATVSAQRGVLLPPADGAEDDVIDPYRRAWEVYEQAATELVPAIEEVARVLRIALSPAAP